MIGTTSDFTSHVSAHAAVSDSLAERVTRVVLAGIGGHLSPASRALVADELPPALGAVVLAGADLARPIELDVIGLGTTVGHARELIASVCRVLAEELSTEAAEAIRAAAPAGLAPLLAAPEAPDPELLPAHTGSDRERETLASGRPGSRHPVSDTRSPGSHTESVAAENPHAATKLSSSSGATQERHRETFAEGHPGPTRPLSGSRS